MSTPFVTSWRDVLEAAELTVSARSYLISQRWLLLGKQLFLSWVEDAPQQVLLPEAPTDIC